MAYYYNPNSPYGAQPGSLIGNELFSGYESLGQGWMPVISQGNYPDLQQIRSLFPDGNVPQDLINEIVAAQSAWKTANPAPSGMSYSDNLGIPPSADQFAWNQGYGNFDTRAQILGPLSHEDDGGGWLNSLMTGAINVASPVLNSLAANPSLLQFAGLVGGAGGFGSLLGQANPLAGYDAAMTGADLSSAGALSAPTSLAGVSAPTSLTGAAAPTGGNVGFFDEMLGLGQDALNPLSGGTYEDQLAQVLGQGGNDAFGGYGAYEDQLAQVLGQGGADLTGATGGTNYLNQISNYLKSIGAGFDPTGVSSGLGGGIMDLINGISKNDMFNKAVSTAPFLAALAYAKGQGAPDLSGLESARSALGGSLPSIAPIDTSRLESIYSQFNPSALTGQYDLATGAGRNQLQSNLTRRGVGGSSFGNFDLGNYDMTRDIGRQALLNQGLTAQSGIAGQIANAQATSGSQALQAAQLGNQRLGMTGDISGRIVDAQLKARQLQNDLYGRGLYGLASVLSPKSSFSFPAS